MAAKAKRSLILGPDGQPVVSAEAVAMDREQRFNPTAGLTPDRLTMQLVAAARGDIRDLAWTMEWMEHHDDLIISVAGKAKSAVSRYGYDVLEDDEIADEHRSLAEEQAAALKEFYQSLEVGHALDLDDAGGTRLMLSQIMDGYGKGYSAHHIVWRPRANGLSAQLIHVPLWFFEHRSGRLRFLRSRWDYTGVDLDSEEMGGRHAWMIAKGRGVMVPCSIAFIFRHIPLQDWLTYCDRHGMPAFLGKTNQEKGSSGWNAMRDAVRHMGAEFAAVVNTGDVIDVLDLTAQGSLPYPGLVERMDRAISILWRGGDLSTISRGGGSVGANPQTEETHDLDGDNAVWVSDCVNNHLSRQVIRWHFGEAVPMLARFRVRTRPRRDIERELKAVEKAVELGMRVSQSWFSDRFAIPIAADDDEEILRKPGQPAQPVPASNTAGGDPVDAALRDLVAVSVAEAMRLRADALAPAADLIDELARKAEGGGLNDTELLEWLERTANRLPGQVDLDIVSDLAARLEADMGAAAVAGARMSLHEAGIDPDAPDEPR